MVSLSSDVAVQATEASLPPPQPSTSTGRGTGHELKCNEQQQQEENNNVHDEPQQNFSCTVCNVTAPNDVVLQRHLSGRRHQVTLRKAERQAKAAAGETVQFTCTFCSVKANSQKQLDAHNAGWRHKQQVFRSDPLNMNEITFQRILGIGFIVVLMLVIFLCFLLLFKCYL